MAGGHPGLRVHDDGCIQTAGYSLGTVSNGRGNMFRLRRSAKMAPMAEKRAKVPRRLPRRSHIHLSRQSSAGASPAGGRSAPAGETHSPALSPCVARPELQSARFANVTRQGGGLSACRNGVIARRDGPYCMLHWATDEKTPWQAANDLQGREQSMRPI